MLLFSYDFILLVSTDTWLFHENISSIFLWTELLTYLFKLPTLSMMFQCTMLRDNGVCLVMKLNVLYLTSWKVLPKVALYTWQRISKFSQFQQTFPDKSKTFLLHYTLFQLTIMNCSIYIKTNEKFIIYIHICRYWDSNLHPSASLLMAYCGTWGRYSLHIYRYEIHVHVDNLVFSDLSRQNCIIIWQEDNFW